MFENCSMESSLENRETRYAGESGPKHEIQKLKKEAQETTQIMVDNVLLHENPVQKKAMERANYLEEASSQFETVKINHVEEQRNCCCNVL